MQTCFGLGAAYDRSGAFFMLRAECSLATDGTCGERRAKVGDLFGDFAFRFGKFGAVPFRFALDAQISGAQEVPILLGFVGRGSWIRTNDLQYPKLPRYQAALYPEYPW